MNNPGSTPLRAFLVVCAVALLAIAAALYWGQQRSVAPPSTEPSPVVAQADDGGIPSGEGTAEPSVEATPVPAAAPTPEAASTAPAEGDLATASNANPAQARKPATPPRRIYFRHTGLDSHYGQFAFVDRPGGVRKFAEGLSCEVAYVAAGRGICLVAKRGVITTYSGKLFDADSFRTLAEFPLQGVPSRNRFAIDGSLAAYTVFLSGHGYTALDFSTQTVLLDGATGQIVADVERDFTVTRDGQVIKETDFNFWGVTFTPDAKGFYATLSTGGKHWLVKGDIAARTVQVIHENVECPSLSPDGRTVAYKKRFVVDDRIVWQLHVLDLASGRETSLAERRSIDDQLEWLDDRTVLYSVPEEGGGGGGTDVWAVPIGGKSPPQRYLASAYSPSVAR
jgi:hypothetical protein